MPLIKHYVIYCLRLPLGFVIVKDYLRSLFLVVVCFFDFSFNGYLAMK